MRIYRVLFVFFLAACQNNLSDNRGSLPAQRGLQEQSKSEMLNEVISRVKPVAEAQCRKSNPDQSRSYCDFRFVVKENASRQPNAFQSVDKDGRPVVTLNAALLKNISNADELAFVLSHEAGHQIASHLRKANGRQVVFGMSGKKSGGFVIGRPKLKSLELEADEIGTTVMFKSGFDPIAGAQSIIKFGTHGGAQSSTHPAIARRLEIVRQTAQRLTVENKGG